MATPNLLGITTVTPGLLNTPAQASTGETAIYTVGASKAAKLSTLVLTNTSGAAVTVSLSVLPSGSTAAAGNRMVSAYSIAAGDDFIVDEVAGMWLQASAFLSLNCSAGSAIVPVLSGLEFS